MLLSKVFANFFIIPLNTGVIADIFYGFSENDYEGEEFSEGCIIHASFVTDDLDSVIQHFHDQEVVYNGNGQITVVTTEGESVSFIVLTPADLPG